MFLNRLIFTQVLPIIYASGMSINAGLHGRYLLWVVIGSKAWNSMIFRKRDSNPFSPKNCITIEKTAFYACWFGFALHWEVGAQVDSGKFFFAVKIDHFGNCAPLIKGYLDSCWNSVVLLRRLLLCRWHLQQLVRSEIEEIGPGWCSCRFTRDRINC